MIVAGMATMPDRLPYLENVVDIIRPQVDALRVYLNNFDEVPGFLRSEEAALSHDAEGDLGAEGKLYWMDGRDGLGECTHCMTIDDDLGYPEDYVAALARELDARDGKAIVGVHASTFSHPMEDFVTSRDERFRFYEPLAKARVVHLLGTATTMWNPQAIDLNLGRDFPMRNASDLQLAIAAQRQQVPMIAIPRPRQWVTERRAWTEDGFSIWKATKAEGHSQAKMQLARAAVERWQLYPDPVDTLSD